MGGRPADEAVEVGDAPVVEEAAVEEVVDAEVPPDEQAAHTKARVPTMVTTSRARAGRVGGRYGRAEGVAVTGRFLVDQSSGRPTPGIRVPARRADTLGLVRRAGRRYHVKIVVDYDECASNAVCMGIAPEVFEVRDDGFLYVLDEHPGEELREKVRQAANGCPTGAITIVEDE
jgi:ferredoxin